MNEKKNPYNGITYTHNGERVAVNGAQSQHFRMLRVAVDRGGVGISLWKNGREYPTDK